MTRGVAFYFENMFENDYRSVEAVMKLVLEFDFDFGNENQITCTRSKQHTFGNVMLCCEKRVVT
jgi:hypothetical protein